MTYPQDTQPYCSTVQMPVLLLMTYMLSVLGSSPHIKEDDILETSPPTSPPTRPPTSPPTVKLGEAGCFGRHCNDPAESDAFMYFFVPVFLCLFCILPSAVALGYGIEKLYSKFNQYYYGDQARPGNARTGADAQITTVPEAYSEGREPDPETGPRELAIRQV